MERQSAYLLMPEVPEVPDVPDEGGGSVAPPPAPVLVDEAPDEVSPPMLLPELARFAFLRQLTMALYYAPPVAAIPPQWGHPGAFPALEL